MGFHDTVDSGEWPGHSYSRKQSIFNDPIAKFTVGLAAAAREGRVGVHPVLAPCGVISCPCCDVGSRKDQAAQLFDAGLHPSSIYVNHSSYGRNALTLLMFVPCQCWKTLSVLCHQRWGFQSSGISIAQIVPGTSAWKLHKSQHNLIMCAVSPMSSQKQSARKAERTASKAFPNWSSWNLQTKCNCMNGKNIIIQPFLWSGKRSALLE